jgi:Mor family transcriptional regulator
MLKLDIPEGYPELLGQMMTVAGETLHRRGIGADQAAELAFEVMEAIRTELGGVQHYLPKAVRWELSARDKKIYKEWTGINFRALAIKYKLTEVRVRDIVKRGQEMQRGKTEPRLFE